MNEGVAWTGIPSEAELAASFGIPTPERKARGRVAVIECVQHIPCNPCVAACPFHAITIPGDITELPHLNGELCTGCGRCVAKCPGLAITLEDASCSPEKGTVDFPYEFLPVPEEGALVHAVNRAGERVCEGTVLQTRRPDPQDGAWVIRISIPKQYLGQVKGIARLPRDREE